MDAKSYVDLKRKSKIPDFRSGDSVRVHAKVVEGDRERIQVFEGVVIRIRTRGPGSSFPVRRVSHGVGGERAEETAAAEGGESEEGGEEISVEAAAGSEAEDESAEGETEEPSGEAEEAEEPTKA